MAKTKLGAGTLLAPLPAVLVSCGDGEKQNLLTIAWTGILCTKPAKTYISVRPERYSYDIIKKSGEFVINLPTAAQVRALDWCGVRSGKNEDKWAACGLTPEPCPDLQFAPAVAQCPVSVACKVEQIIPLGSHDMFIAEILSVSVDDSLLDKTGKLNYEKADLVAYSHGSYYQLGKYLGSFGYSVRKKPVHKPVPRKKTPSKK